MEEREGYCMDGALVRDLTLNATCDVAPDHTEENDIVGVDGRAGLSKCDEVASVHETLCVGKNSLSKHYLYILKTLR